MLISFMMLALFTKSNLKSIIYLLFTLRNENRKDDEWEREGRRLGVKVGDMWKN